jgi:hypothetical protein
MFPRSIVEDPRIELLPHIPLAPQGLRRLKDVEAMPSLVALKPAEAPHLECLVQNLIGAHDGELHENDRDIPLIASLIHVQPGKVVEQIAAHLAQRLILVCRKHKEHGLLRYYQADTFLHLRRILGKQWLASLYGPILEWTFPFQGQWLSFAPPVLDPEKDIVPLFWSVDGPMLDSIQKIASINRALDFYRDEYEYIWPDIAAHDHDAQIAERALSDAETVGLHDEKDKIAFAMHALAHGPRFHMHPEIRSVFEALGSESYRFAASLISPDRWQQIALETQY